MLTNARARSGLLAGLPAGALCCPASGVGPHSRCQGDQLGGNRRRRRTDGAAHIQARAEGAATVIPPSLEPLGPPCRDGLLPPQVARRLHAFGPNSIEEKKRNPLLHFFSFMWNPLRRGPCSRRAGQKGRAAQFLSPCSWVMEAAAILAIGATYGCCPTGPPDWEDFVGMYTLLASNLPRLCMYCCTHGRPSCKGPSTSRHHHPSAAQLFDRVHRGQVGCRCGCRSQGRPGAQVSTSQPGRLHKC